MRQASPSQRDICHYGHLCQRRALSRCIGHQLVCVLVPLTSPPPPWCVFVKVSWLTCKRHSTLVIEVDGRQLDRAFIRHRSKLFAILPQAQMRLTGCWHSPVTVAKLAEVIFVWLGVWWAHNGRDCPQVGRLLPRVTWRQELWAASSVSDLSPLWVMVGRRYHYSSSTPMPVSGQTYLCTVVCYALDNCTILIVYWYIVYCLLVCWCAISTLVWASWNKYNSSQIQSIIRTGFTWFIPF